jgi:hypothetical protein
MLSTPAMNTKALRATRSDGERSRQTILQAAARLATVDGLNGLSIGHLTEHIGMSETASTLTSAQGRAAARHRRNCRRIFSNDVIR